MTPLLGVTIKSSGRTLTAPNFKLLIFRGIQLYETPRAPSTTIFAVKLGPVIA